MALKTDYLDFIPPAGGRVYQLTTVDAVTQKYNITDVTEYTQDGNTFGAMDMNATNTKVNEEEAARAWKNITVSTPSVSGNVRTYNFDFSEKQVSEICLYVLGIGYAVLDVRCLPGLLEFNYFVPYQDANLTSRTIVTGSVSGDILTISLNTDYTSAPAVYSVLSALYYR